MGNRSRAHHNPNPTPRAPTLGKKRPLRTSEVPPTQRQTTPRKKKPAFSGFYYLKTGPVFIRFLFQPNKNRGASAASYGYLACLRVHAQVHTGLSTAYLLLVLRFFLPLFFLAAAFFLLLAVAPFLFFLAPFI